MGLGYKIIAVDFDGTLCENKWPEIGKPNTKLIEYLKEQKAAGNKAILWTCRTGNLLTDANWWCHAYGLWFDAVNENLPEVIEKMGGDSRKIFAHEYIDDRMVNQYLDIPSAYPENDILKEQIHKLTVEASKTSECLSLAGRALINAARQAKFATMIRKNDEKLHTLEQVSGRDIDTLISLFADGCTLITPELNNEGED